MQIIIIDYSMGNLKSIQNILRFVGANNIVISDCQEDIKRADKIILPGVGAFNEAIKHIKEKQLDQHLTEAVLLQKKPILGICLGMQLLSKSSSENGDHKGLSFVPADVSKFATNVKIPHVGFNQVTINPKLKLYKGMQGEMDFYFTHSYRMNTAQEINQCFCRYEQESFIASYEINNIAGVQFHPELSQTNGIKLIKNFLDNF